MLPNQQFTGSPLRNKSPVHHIKSPGYYQTGNTSLSQQQQSAIQRSNFTSSYQQKEISPIKQQPMMQEADLYKSKCNELENNLTQVKTELEIANYKAKKTKEIEEKCDLILKQNQALLDENDKIQKSLNDKNAESQIWKEKCDKQMNSLIQMKATYELDLKKAYTEISKLKDQLQDSHTEKHKLIEEARTSMIVSGTEKVETLKKSYAKNASLYEEQQRKLCDIIDEREKEIAELQNKIQHLRAESEIEIQRINDDREKLRKQISDLQKVQQDQLDMQKYKLDEQYNKQTQNLKSLHSNEVDILETEIRKLKKLLETKNVDIQQLIMQNSNQKKNFDQDSEDLKMEIQVLKEKLLENNKQNEEEVNDLKEKLATLHTTDISELKNKHDMMLNGLREENQNLRALLNKKAEELEIQIKEKQQQRDSYNMENQRLKQEIEDHRYQIQYKEKEAQRQFVEQSQMIEKNQSTHNEFSDQLKTQISFLNNEIENLKQLLVKKNNELDEYIAKFQTYKSKADEDIRLLTEENEEWKRQYNGLENEKEVIIEEYKIKFSKQDNEYTDKFRKLEFQNNTQENQIRSLQEQLNLKSEENNNLLFAKQQLENEIKKLKHEIDSLAEQILMQDKMKIREIEELRAKLEQSNDFALESMKVSHSNQINVLQADIQNLKLIIENRDNTIQDMVDKYQQLEAAFGEFKDNRDKFDDYEKKIQMLNAELVTTKNLYDVFVRTKQRFSQRKQ